MFAGRNNSERVFVYGTLRRGGRNAQLLRRARYLGEHITPARYRLYDFGHCPGVRRGGSTAVRGEVYAVTPAILKRLDILEDAPRSYIRERVNTPWGPAWLYLLRYRPLQARELAGGDWLREYRRR